MGNTVHDSFPKDLFIRQVIDAGHKVEAETVVARDNIYRVDGRAYLLVRTSRFHDRRGVYFFGLTRHIFDNFAQVPGALIAFVMSDTMEPILVPAKWLWERRHKLSSSAKQFKLELDKNAFLKAPKGPGNAIDLSAFRVGLSALGALASTTPSLTDGEKEPRKHTDLQGMLLEMGNLRGLATYSPNRSPKFKGKSLGEIATLKELPEFPSINAGIVRQIDVIWLEGSFPVHAFEVELTTGIWSGLIRLGELRRLNTVFHIVTDGDDKAFRRRIAGDIFTEIAQRCHHASARDVQSLYETEKHVDAIRRRVAL